MSSPTTSPNLPLFGRKYKLEIKFPPNASGGQTILTLADSSFEPEALRIAFDVYMPAWSIYWFADISIWNLDEATTLQILGDNSSGPSGVKQGMEVILSAGYLNGNYGVIWDGFVFQPMWDREQVTDYRIRLNCLIGLGDLTRNFVNSTYGSASAGGVTQTELLQRMVKDAYYPISLQPNALSDSLGKTLTNPNGSPLKRGMTVFGNPDKYFNWIASENNAQKWMTSKGLTLANINSDVSTSPDDVVVYTPETGLIGTPVQTQYGADFRVLLDPRIQTKKPIMQIKVDHTLIRQQKRQIGVLPGLLDQDGQYIVLSVRHIGDSRGQDWYTEITGVTSLNGKAAMLTAIGTDISQ